MRLGQRAWRTLVCAGLVLSVTASGITSAAAVERKPPRAVLRHHGETIQRGLLITYCWTYREPDSDYGVGVCADGTYSWPDPAEVSAPTRLSMRFRKAQRPRRLSISAYPDVTRNGTPRGERERLDYRLRPVRSRGEVVAWDAHFSLRDAARHYYIGTFAVWREGDAFYTFHVKTG